MQARKRWKRRSTVNKSVLYVWKNIFHLMWTHACTPVWKDLDGSHACASVHVRTALVCQLKLKHGLLWEECPLYVITERLLECVQLSGAAPSPSLPHLQVSEGINKGIQATAWIGNGKLLFTPMERSSTSCLKTIKVWNFCKGVTELK